MAKAIYAGDAGLFKICSKCEAVKPSSHFYASPDGAFGFRGDCRECTVRRGKRWYDENPETVRRYLDANRDRIIRNSNRRRIENPNYHKQWRDANRDRVRAKQREANEKHRMKPYRRLCDAVSANINNSIRKGSRQGRGTFELLGYTREELMRHLEKQFDPGMSWANYGVEGWHIDHIIPVTAFNFDSPDHEDFRRCWALTNLQPLWGRENISKGNRLDAPFQPSLAI